MENINPAFQSYAVPTPYEPRSQMPSPRKPQTVNVPAAVRRIILDLSLRFQPTDEGKRAAFNDKVALLASDCATVPSQWLEDAAAAWIAEGDGFLPTASALIKLAQQAQAKSQEQANATTNWYRIYLEKAVLRNVDLAASTDPQQQKHRWLPKRGGGMEIMSKEAFDDERKRAAGMKAEGNANYDRRFDDMAAMYHQIVRRAA